MEPSMNETIAYAAVLNTVSANRENLGWAVNRHKLTEKIVASLIANGVIAKDTKE